MLKILLISFLFISTQSMEISAQNLSAEEVVQRNLDCYNNKDIDGFMSYFSDDVEFYEFETFKPSIQGKEDCRKRYNILFEQSPNLHSTILKRIVFDNKVIDHEYITGRNGADIPLELVLIYEVREEKIFRVSVMRK
jgi:hypothetical protein